MPPQFATNPHDLVEPDYASPEYEEQVTALVTPDCTAEQARDWLKRAWTIQNTSDRAKWDAEQTRLADEAAAHAAAEKDEREAVVAARAKKFPKAAPMDYTARVSSSTLLLPIQAIRDRVAADKYVALWYFTPEGLAAYAGTALVPTETITLGPNNTLQRSDVVKHDKEVPDTDLCRIGFVSCQSVFLATLVHVGKSQAYVQDVSNFFYIIGHHEYNQRGDMGQRTLMAYVSHSRQDQLAHIAQHGTAFPLAEIDKTLLASIYDKFTAQGYAIH